MTDSTPEFVIAGGGTGGHLYPGLVVAEALQAIRPDSRIVVFGTNRPIDRKLVEPRGFELIEQVVEPFSNKPWRWPRFYWRWQEAILAVKQRYWSHPPAAVLGLGGYAAGPPVVTAAKKGIPTAIFNPDAVPGRANAMLGGKVDRVFVQWNPTLEHFAHAKYSRCTGCPVRPAFASADRNKSVAALGLDPHKKTLLITGASQGAHTINMAILAMCPLWRQFADWQLLHLTGEADIEGCRRKYDAEHVTAKTLAFTEQMASCMAAADLVISRAGASTLAEITAIGAASILFPYPYDSKQHQRANADVLVSHKAAILIHDAKDPDANANRLREVLPSLMQSDERRHRLARAAAALGRHDAADTIARELLDMAGLH